MRSAPARFRILCLLLLAGCSSESPISPANDDGANLSFQNGANGYSGVEDVSISDQYGGNGQLMTTGELMTWSLSGADSYTVESLLRFNDLSLPAGTVVTSASLTLTFDNWSKDFTVHGYYMKTPWAVSGALGWLNRDAGLSWAEPGVRGSGTDFLASPTFSFGGFVGSGVETKTVALDPDVVQSWITTPGANQGVLLVNDAVDKVTRIYSSETKKRSRRPRLSITYTSASTPPPPTDTTAPSVAFTAPVDGATVSGSVGLSANATDDVGVSSLRFAVDGSAIGATLTAPPYTVTLDTTSLADGGHTLSATAQDAAGNVATATIQIAVASASTPPPPTDTTAPSVAFTAPADGATVAGSIGLSASATDDVGVNSLRFAVDGAAIGSTLSAPPYSVTLDTTSLSDGGHTLSATAQDAAGNVATSRIQITVHNAAQPVCVAGSSSSWTNSSFSPGGDPFTVTFDATPSAAPTDAVVGISSGAANSFASLATIVRFNAAGTIDARDGNTYGASTSVPYLSNTTYHFRLTIDVYAHVYSVYVTPSGGTEQLIGDNFAFRTEQDAVTSLDNWVIDVDTASNDTLSVCQFTVEATSTPPPPNPDPPPSSNPPTVSLTSPTQGATVSGSITLAATATSSVGIAGVTFLVDDAPFGAEDTSAPYAMTFDTTVLSNATHSFAARARDTSGNVSTSPDTNVAVNNPIVTSGEHPRIWLDSTSLASLRQKAQANDAAWTRLRNACNSYLGGNVELASGNAYPNLPNIGEGYQGSGYFDPLLNTGVCYQIGVGIGDANTNAWAQKGADILTKMATFTNYSRDDGYGIRFYGVGMALGYDFLHDALSAGAKSQIYGALNGWLAWFTTNGFGEGHPQGNYFAGYYAAKAYAGIATEGDNPNAAALWDDFLNRLHRGGPGSLTGPDGKHSGVQLYYSKYMVGGGWSEGWGYGPLAVSNMALPSLAAKTAKGIDLIQDFSAPFTYPYDNGMHFMQFTWPSRAMLDDRDTLHSGNAGESFPAAPSPSALVVTEAILERWNHSLAPEFHSFVREIRNKFGMASPWQEFVFWDDNAAEASYTTLPTSYLSRGMNVVAMRSDWSTTATWASFRASAYVDYSWAGEQDYDAGGLAIVKGGTPLLANATGVLVTTYPGSSGGGLYETQVIDDIYGSSTRKLFNTFYNGNGVQTETLVDDSVPPATGVTHFEDGGGYVRMRGEHLEDVYSSNANVNAWTRDVVYFRPSLFVIYDRTTVADTSGDEHMSWHLFSTPQSASAPSAGAVRYDVNNSAAGFLGAVTTLLPASAKTSLVNVFNSNKVYRLEVRPSAPATDTRWLTVFDTASSAGAVGLASALSTSANVKGALVTQAAGNRVVLFGSGAAGTVVSGAITFTTPAAATRLVAVDLQPNTAYAVNATASGSSLNVTIQAGTGFATSAAGTLYVSVAANGAVSAGP